MKISCVIKKMLNKAFKLQAICSNIGNYVIISLDCSLTFPISSSCLRNSYQISLQFADLFCQLVRIMIFIKGQYCRVYQHIKHMNSLQYISVNIKLVFHFLLFFSLLYLKSCNLNINHRLKKLVKTHKIPSSVNNYPPK